ncbi:Tyrosine--tRNA ligase [Gimesia alba]|uniref:Tyrosine--tRNA ligase n=1 Tax=Gimesia alba TaxID=2527973 RepID=A0A517R9S8_9PLAN|nr:tyrosine--tRNA ligase [Gimesia alba]QDT40533.1 Tyrosine--tRNA ligase [Gimesia alba]
MQFLPVEEQLAVIRRGVEKIVPEQELAEKLKWSRESGIPLRVKYGIDPTGIDLHLGHTVPMRKMRQFQELGHQAVIIIGNYTALVGDPSGRDETRARLTAEQVEANAVDYLNQVGKVIDLEQAEVVRNGDWFSKMNFADILELCSKVTVAQLLTRDDFSKRYREEAAIYLHECLYPIMQAWDSVEIKADIELGGTEQLYSFMLARDLQKDQGLKQQVSVMSPILVGTDGVRRMGKSLGNYIGISEAPYEMMKKFMQLSDDSMPMFYELLTDFPLEEVKTILQGHPKEAKVQLAKTIITEYHDAAEAEEAAQRWQREIGSGGMPAEIPVVTLSKSKLNEDGTLPAANLLKEAGLCTSTSEARRSIQQKGAKMGEEKILIDAHDQAIAVESGLLLWVGRKRFCQVELVD